LFSGDRRSDFGRTGDTRDLLSQCRGTTESEKSSARKDGTGDCHAEMLPLFSNSSALLAGGKEYAKLGQSNVV
jgi:hypothetical protein